MARHKSTLRRHARREVFRTMLRVEALENRSMLAVVSGFSGGILSVSGDAADDAIAITVDGSGNFLVNGSQVQDSSTLAFAGNATATKIQVSGGGGADFYSHSLSITVPTNFNGGEATDSISVSGDRNFIVAAARIVDTTLTFSNIERAIVTGGASANQISNSGFAGVSEFNGGGGNDALRGGAANDQLYGEEGNDAINGFGGEDLIHGGIGNDNLLGGDAADQIFGEAGFDTINGSEGNDLLDGGADGDTITDLIGNNEIHGGAANDKVTTGSGNDTTYGDDGADTINAGDGLNFIYGGTGADKLTGGSSGDLFVPGVGADQVHGGGGQDTYQDERNAFFTISDTTIKIGREIDTLDAIENAVLLGGEGRNIFTVNAGQLDVTITPNGGHDRLVFNIASGANISGDMTLGNLTIAGLNQTVSTTGNSFEEVMIYSISTVTLDVFRFENFKGTIQRLNGGDRVEYINDADMTLNGATLSDTTGNLIDFTGVRAANLYLTGGASNNTFRINSPGANVTTEGAGGTDTLLVTANDDFKISGGSVAGDLGIIIGATGRVNAAPSTEGVTVTGGEGNNRFDITDNGIMSVGKLTLRGLGGRDQVSYQLDYHVIGAAQNITVMPNEIRSSVRPNNDIALSSFESYRVVGGNNNDTINAFFVGGTAFNEVEVAIYGGKGHDTIQGGSNAVNILDGGDGNDELTGGNQDDELYGGEGSDTLNGGGGDDSLYGEIGNDRLFGGDGFDWFDGGDGLDTAVQPGTGDTLSSIEETEQQ